MKYSDKWYIRGVCWAMAFHISEGGAVKSEEFLSESGFSIKDLEEAKVDKFDLDKIKNYLGDCQSYVKDFMQTNEKASSTKGDKDGK